MLVRVRVPPSAPLAPNHFIWLGAFSLHNNRPKQTIKKGLPGAGTPQGTIYDVYEGLFRKELNAMSAAEREDYLRALECASPAFIDFGRRMEGSP